MRHPVLALCADLFTHTPRHVSGSHALAVSLNAQQYTVEPLQFVVHAPPEVAALSPTLGPAAGGTLVGNAGANLTSGCDYTCAFNESVVPARHDGGAARVLCVVPSSLPSAESVAVRVSLNAQQYTAPLPLDLYPSPAVSALSPSMGPVVGGTHVAVLGANFRNLSTAHCRFGRTLVAARYVGASYFECDAPPPASAVAGSSPLFLPPDGAYPAQVACNCSALAGGDATVDATAVRLVGAADEFGYWGLSSQALLPPELVGAPLPSLDLRFELFVGSPDPVASAGLEGAELSFTFHYGPPPAAAAASETDFGGGLRVQLSSRMPQLLRGVRVRVWLADAEVHTAYLERPLRTNALVPMRVRVDDADGGGARLLLEYGGSQLLDGLLLHGLEPAAGWHLAFAATAGPHSHAVMMVDNARLAGDAADEPTTAGVDVTLNLQDYSPEVPYGFYAAPALSVVSPTSGPTEGGTLVQVTGLPLARGPDMRCRFTGQGINWVRATLGDGNTSVWCTTPAELAAHDAAGVGVRLEVTLNGQNWALGPEWRAYAPPAISRLSVSFGPSHGGTTVTLHGAGFAPAATPRLRCRFGGGPACAACLDSTGTPLIVPASFAADGAGERVVVCVSPSAAEADDPLELTLNGQQWSSSSLPFTFYAPPVISALLPPSGWSDGGTTVLLAGSALVNHTDDFWCRFGAHLVPATVSDGLPSGELVRCESPAALAAGAESSLLLDFQSEALRESDELRGGAYLGGDGSLTLTDADYHQLGLLIVSPPVPDRAYSSFDAAFDVFVGGGTGGDGFKFCFGEPTAARAGRLEVEVGVCVRFRTHDERDGHYEAVDVLVDGVLQHTLDMRTLDLLRAGTWAPVAVSHGTDGLRVSCSQQLLLERVLLRAFEPAAGWAFVLGASTSAYHNEHKVDNLRIDVGALVAPSAVDVDLTLNGQQFSTTQPFTYFSTPVVSSCSPLGGPVAGGTLVGIFGHALAPATPSAVRCAFNDTVVHATYSSEDGLVGTIGVARDTILCRSPASMANVSGNATDAGSYVLRVAFNAHDDPLHDLFARASMDFSVSAAAFDALPPVEVSLLQPPSGPADGGAQLLLHGAGFAEGDNRTRFCRFNGASEDGSAGVVVVAQLVTPSQLVCTTPPVPREGPLAVEVSTNGQDFSGSGLNYTFQARVAVSTIDPPTGPAVGGTLVTLGGEFSAVGSSYHCRFAADEPWVLATRESAASLLCVSRRLPAGPYDVSVSLNAQDLSNSSARFDAYDEPAVLRLSPNSGPVGGNTLVTIDGDGFAAGSTRRCHFNDTAFNNTVVGANASADLATLDAEARAVVVASVVGDGTLLCRTPASRSGSALALSVTLNGQQFVRTSLQVEQYVEPETRSLSPFTGPVLGGTAVLVHGDGLQGGSDPRCQFGDAPPVPALPLPGGGGNLTCTSTAAAAAAPAALRLALNAQQYVLQPTPFHYTRLPAELSPSPASGPVAGATLLTLTQPGGGSFDGDNFQCRFADPRRNSTVLFPVDAIVAPATRADQARELACYAPALSAGPVELEVALNGQQFSNSSARLVAYDYPSFASIVPDSGPAEGGTHVTIRGSALAGGVHYQCRYDFGAGSRVVVPADYINATEPLYAHEEGLPALDQHGGPGVVCRTAAAAGPTACTVEVSLNGQQFTEAWRSIGYSFYEPLRISWVTPTTGPVEGGTRLVLHGFAYQDTPELRCKFGHVAVVAANFSAVEHSSEAANFSAWCTSPPRPLDLSGAAPLVNFSARQLFGAAVVADAGGVSLTNDSFFSAGTAFLDTAAAADAGARDTDDAQASGRLGDPRATSVSAPGTFAIRSFALAFKLSLVAVGESDGLATGVSHGDGVSLSFGELAHGLISERGAGLGLRVLLRTFTYNRVDVLLGGRLLHTRPLSLPLGNATPVRIEVRQAELSVHVADDRVVADLPLIGWDPQPRWRMALGARSGASAAAHALADVRLSASRLKDVHTVLVELSANTQDFSVDAVPFGYLSPPTFARISPTTGPVAGGTHTTLVSTRLRFGSDYRVAFGSEVVQGTYESGTYAYGGELLLSTAPAQDAAQGETDVLVTFNGQQYNHAANFTYHAAPRVSTLSPSSGPAVGGTLLSLRGTDFSCAGARCSGYLCRFNVTADTGYERVLPGALVVPASFDRADPRALACVAPTTLPRGTHAFEVSLNAQQFSSSDTTYTVYAPPAVLSLSPSSGPLDGDSLVTVTGANFTNAGGSSGTHFLCRFGDNESIVNATFLADTALGCYSPASAAGAAVVPLEVYLNGQDVTQDGVAYTYYEPPAPTGMCPTSGPALGGTSVRVASAAFANGSDYRVELRSASNGTHVVPPGYAPATTRVVDEGTIGFVTPVLVAPGHRRVRVALNAQQYSGRVGDGFHVYPHPQVHGIAPRCGPEDGNTTVFVRGKSLANGSHPLCDFGSRSLLSSSEHARFSSLPQYSTLVNGTPSAAGLAMVCVSPPSPLNGSALPSGGPLELTLNGQQFTTDTVEWLFTARPLVSIVVPTSGVTAGGTLLTVHGAGFLGACLPRCSFGGIERFVNASVADDGRMLCHTPPGDADYVSTVEVSLNAQQYTDDGATFTYYPPFTTDDVRPVSSPLRGGTVVTLRGSGFQDFPTLQCKFGDAAAQPFPSTPTPQGAADDVGKGALVLATRVNSGEALCLSPLVSHLVPPAHKVGVHTDFQSRPAELLTGGAAAVEGGVLKLTSVVLGDLTPAATAGWVRTSFPPPVPALQEWAAEFELYAGGGTIGQGFSFVYGPLDGNDVEGLTAHGVSMTENVPFRGIEVLFLTAEEYLHVRHNGTTVGVWSAPGVFRSEAWSHMGIELARDNDVGGAHRLTITLDGRTSWSEAPVQTGAGGVPVRSVGAPSSTAGIVVDGWEAQREWAFAIGASTSTHTDFHWIDDLRISSAWLTEGPEVYPLQLSLNGQQFEPAFDANHGGAVNITYFAEHAVSTILPGTGPAAGDTHILATGINFRNGDNYTCRFGETVVGANFLSDGSVECYSPSYDVTAGAEADSPDYDARTKSIKVPFAISPNNQYYSRDVVDFYYKEEAAVSFLSPDAGPTFGGTQVLVHGANLAGGDAYRCKFGEQKVLASLHGSKTVGYYVECYAPKINASGVDVHVPLEVSLNNQQYTRSVVRYRYFSQREIVTLSPTSGPVEGSTTVLVAFSSEGATSDIAFYCGFGGLLTIGVRVSNRYISCPSAAHPSVGPAMVSISTNGQQFSNVKEFVYFAAPVISAISPTSGPLLGDTFLNVSGVHLINGSDYRCRLGAEPHVTIPATFHAGPPQMIACTAPAMPFDTGAVPLEVSLNAQQYTDDGHEMQFYAAPALSALSPATGPLAGGTRMVISGGALHDGSHYVCRFEPRDTPTPTDDDDLAGFVGVAGAVQRVPATHISHEAVVCYTPSVPIAGGGSEEYSVTLALNGQQFTPKEEVAFGYHGAHAVLSLSPASGPLDGDTHVVISGAHLANGSDYQCRFGDALPVYATWHGRNTSLVCIAPNASGVRGYGSVEVTTNGQQYTQDGVQYAYYGPANVTHIYPVAGPRYGGTLVALVGERLDLGSDPRCAFGPPDRTGPLRDDVLRPGREDGPTIVQATFVHEALLRCHAPNHTAGTVTVTISLNSQQYVPSDYRNGTEFVYYEPHAVLSLSPNTGSAEGGTVVTLSGARLRDFAPHPVLCRFGSAVTGALAVTTHLANDTLLCIAPPAEKSGVAHRMRADFGDDAVPATAGVGSGGDDALVTPGTLLGHAALVGGALQLTPNEPFKTGAYVLDIGARTQNISQLRLRAHVFVGGGNLNPGNPHVADQYGGMGLSFVYGRLPGGAPFGELGASAGLRVLFLTNDSHVVVRMGERTLARAPVPFGLRRDRYWLLQLDHDGSSLQVHIDGRLIVPPLDVDLHADCRAPFGADCTFAFGARTGLRHDLHLLQNLTLTTGPYLLASSVDVEVTTDRQWFSGDRVQFLYLPPTAVSYLSVDRGPLAGGTLVHVYGSNFTGGSHTMCKFGDYAVPGSVVNASGPAPSAMRCYSPPPHPPWRPNIATSVPLEVTLNGKVRAPPSLRPTQLSPSTATPLHARLTGLLDERRALHFLRACPLVGLAYGRAAHRRRAHHAARPRLRRGCRLRALPVPLPQRGGAAGARDVRRGQRHAAVHLAVPAVGGHHAAGGERQRAAVRHARAQHDLLRRERHRCHRVGDVDDAFARVGDVAALQHLPWQPAGQRERRRADRLFARLVQVPVRRCRVARRAAAHGVRLQRDARRRSLVGYIDRAREPPRRRAARVRRAERTRRRCRAARRCDVR